MLGSLFLSGQAFCNSEADRLVVVGEIVFSGNEKTLPETILRELAFDRGDTMTMQTLEASIRQSKRNLLNTSLFNFVDGQIAGLEDMPAPKADVPAVTVLFSFVERWYFWPIPILEVRDHNLNAWLEKPSLSKLNYGVMLRLGNMAGRNEQLNILIKTGYHENYALAMQTPYFNRAQNIAIGMEAGLEMSRESAYRTERNNPLYYKSRHFVFTRNYGLLTLFIRPGIHGNHRLFLGYDQYVYADTLQRLNTRFLPGNRNRFSYMTLGYEYRLDHRDNKAYPLNGYHAFFSAKRLGMGVLEEERIDALILKGSLRLFMEMAPRWYFASGVSAKWSDGTTLAYYNQRGLGFDRDVVRGYENYIVDAQGYIVLKANTKYALLTQRSASLSFIPSEKFSRIHYALYLGFFIDAGYAYDKYFYHNNPLNNKILAGFGTGLDFVTYYDKVFRAEFSVNRRGEAGVYFHVIAPI